MNFLVALFFGMTFISGGALSAGFSSSDDHCSVYINDQIKREIKPFYVREANEGARQWNIDIEDAQEDLIYSLERKGFHLVGEKVEARYTITKFHKACSMLEGNCHIGHANISFLDNKFGEEFGYHYRDIGYGHELFGTSIIEASKNRAFRKALEYIPNCER